ncbi:hypothetical protein BSL78_07590 [Apostichopus japonicus]|uniref:Reverse transcriptase domain-containing protein n=1 Tax=Stichopus japonicus TaxID=307972 RepID=A0A2G8L5F6_STIJA|nr:hypothetical protein BSL78_07590 [Apostichopus japonicus]
MTQAFLPPFNTTYDGEEDWDCYVERFELFLTANGLDMANCDNNARVIAMFLHALGARFYAIVRNLVAPSKPKDKSYTELKNTLRKHLKSTPMVVAERRKFLRRDQQPGESTADYVVQLKQLSLNCSYGNKLDENLRDRFISGLREEPTALKLMEKVSEKDTFTFNQTVEFALSRESTFEGARAMRSETTSTSPMTNVNTVQRKQGPNSNKASTRRCYRCGRNHNSDECWFKNTKCRKCSKIGHIERVCRSKRSQPENWRKQQSHQKKENKQSDSGHHETKSKTVNKLDDNMEVQRATSNGQSESYNYTMFKLSEGKAMNNDNSAIYVPVEIEGNIVNMEIDTGSGVSMIPISYYEKYLKHIPLLPGDKQFTSFTGQSVNPSGKVYVNVKYGNYDGKLRLYVVDCTEFYLLGREWLSMIPLDWKSLFRPIKPDRVLKVSDLEQVIDKHRELFDDSLGKLSEAKAKIVLREEAQPVMRKPHRVPYALKAQVEAELVRLQKNGVLTPVSHSEWGTSIVAVPKKDGSVRLCGNYKNTINPLLKPVAPPAINVDDILANLCGGVVFSKLDLAHAYNQMELDESSTQFLTLSTHKGLFQQNRLVFGITTAPAIWQSAIEQVLQGLPGVQVYLDDILVTGRTKEEHLSNLDQVLTRLKDRGLKLKEEKCDFLRESVHFLGHVIDAHGVHKSTAKVDQINAMQEPTDIGQLRSYLGMLNYYRKYLPNLATVLTPLTVLLEKGRKFEWTTEAAEAFETSKL